ncbi:Fc.00g113710.m01.CDS01 [Cosmosporella sp. VM-42]
MNATKRKFNALLQGLGTSRSRTTDDSSSNANLHSPSQPTASSRPATRAAGLEAEILQKRRRLGLPDSTAPILRSPSLIDLSSTSPGARKPAKQADVATKTELPARYSPTDRGELLKRLGTFQEITDWTPKPDGVNEVEWAKRGWVCHGKETVRCLLCYKELVVKLNRKLVDGKEVPVLVSSEIEDALVAKYTDLMVTSHQEDCLWRKRGCDDSLLRLSLANASTSLEGLRQRYDELCSRKSFLPYEFNLRLPDELELDKVVSQLPSDFFMNPAHSNGSMDQPPNRVALALALLGWQGLSNTRIGAVPNSASCHTCLRRLGLWMFKSKEVSDAGEILVPAPMDFLDPIREHRFFCPWANAVAQSRGGSQPREITELPGWKVLAQTLANDAHLRSVYEGRPRTRQQLDKIASHPSTPQKTGVVATPSGISPRTTPATPYDAVPSTGNVEEDEGGRDAKDKERWARLRRVKSLFDTKGSRKFKRSISRPGTGYSARSVGGTKDGNGPQVF